MSVAPLQRVVDATLEATVVLSFSRVGYLVRSRLSGWPALERLDGRGRTVVVTGANSGLGYATARALLRSGARVCLLVRTAEKAESTVARLRRDVGGPVDVASVTADLTDLTSVRDAAEQLRDREPRIDALVHNAGAMFAEHARTGDGLERTYQVHVVAPHLLTGLLLPTFVASAPARVVTVTSGGMYTQRLDVDRLISPDDYRPSVAYARAKRAQVALTGQWQRRFGSSGVDFHVVHPGWALTPGIETSLPTFRRVVGPLLRDADQGADSIVWLTLSGAAHPGGRLWLDRTPRLSHRVPWTLPAAGEADRLWSRVSTDAGLEPSR